MKKTLLFLIALFISCTEPVSAPPSPVGTWSYTTIINSFAVALVTEIAANHTYESTGGIITSNMTVKTSEEFGTWSQSDNAVTLTPSSCRMFDSLKNTLVSVPVGSPSTFTLSGDTLKALDGSFAMNRGK